MSTNIFYKKAIDILAQTHTNEDWYKICVEIAKEDPEFFCNIAGDHQTSWTFKAKVIYTNEGKLPAIKYVRRETGMGLKEAKETIEELCSNLTPPTTYGSMSCRDTK